MDTEEDKKIQKEIIAMLHTEAQKINPDPAAFSAVLEKMREPVLSTYFQFEKKTFMIAGAVALALFILVVPQIKSETVAADPTASDVVSTLSANADREDASLSQNGEASLLSSFDQETSNDLNQMY